MTIFMIIILKYRIVRINHLPIFQNHKKVTFAMNHCLLLDIVYHHFFHRQFYEFVQKHDDENFHDEMLLK